MTADNQTLPKVGTEMPDHSIFAGLTADGKQQIYAMPVDLSVRATFNNTVKAVDKLNADNALGHNDWQIPSVKDLHVLQKNQNEVKLKGTFNNEVGRGIAFPGWYWSSSKGHTHRSYVHTIRFSNGDQYWEYQSHARLSCRPVRLVPVG